MSKAQSVFIKFYIPLKVSLFVPTRYQTNVKIFLLHFKNSFSPCSFMQ